MQVLARIDMPRHMGGMHATRVQRSQAKEADGL